MSPSLPVRIHRPPIRQVARGSYYDVRGKNWYFWGMQGLWTLFQIFICIPQSCVCLTVVIIRDSVDKSYVSLCTENGLEDDDSSVDSFRGAVPQTSLLDTSANRDKGQLVSSANKNRRPPTKRNIKVTRQIYLPGALTKIRGSLCSSYYGNFIVLHV